MTSQFNKEQIKLEYPEVFDSYSLQLSVQPGLCDERLSFWASNGITCFEKWAVPYFFRCENEKKRPCLRLNYPYDGKCSECNKGTCKYDKVCFMCGQEGHGAFQTFPGGKLKGELKCTKHRSFLLQMEELQKKYNLSDSELREIFKTDHYVDWKHSSGPSSKVSSIQQPTTDVDEWAPLEFTDGPLPLEDSEEASETIAPGTKHSYSAISSSLADSGSTGLNGHLPPLAWPLSPPRSAYEDVVLPPSVELGPSIWSTPLQSRSDSITSPYLGPMGLPNAQGIGQITHTPFSNTSLHGISPASSTDIMVAQPLPSSAISLRPGSSSLSGSIRSPLPPSSPVIGPRRVSGSTGANSSPRLHSEVNRSRTNSSGSGGLITSNQTTPNFVTVDITNSDEYHFFTSGVTQGPSSRVTLKCAPWLSAKENNCGPSLSSYKGVLVPYSDEYMEEVTVLAWSINPVNSTSGGVNQRPVDPHALAKELKTLRILARTHPVGISRVLTKRPLALPGSTALPPLHALLTEYSDIGYLDRFVETHVNGNPTGFSIADLRCCASMLTDALLHCHRMQVCHRDLRPSTVLVTRPARYQRDLLLGQFNLKLTDFRLSSLQPLYYESSGQEPEAERFSAPEVTPVSRNSGMGFEASSDVWSLGMVMYYLACGGACMIEDPRDLLLMSPERTSSLGPGQASGQTEDESQQLMHTLSQRHGLQERSPVLYDFVDRTARPLGRRISSALLRCHPLLWPLTRKREFLLSFSQTGLDESTMHGVSGQPPAHLEPFLVAFDKYAPQYVFGAQGWVQSMSPALLNLVRPISVRNEHWWSGRGLLQALRSHLLQPDALAAVYTGLSPAQVLAAYIRELTEVCFPRLLNLVFELGGTYGAWSWDGDEVGHRWR